MSFDKIIHHLKHRLSLKTITKEVVAHLEKKVIPHGCDEIGNVLFSGSAYLPWPGSNGPEPIDTPPMEPKEPEPTAFDAHAALYGVSYDQAVQNSARRDNNDDRGRSR